MSVACELLAEAASPGRRVLIPLSYSQRNPAAVRVMTELAQRDLTQAVIWEWAAAYLDGLAPEAALARKDGLSDADLDALLESL